ncbi:CYTH and CHAD domain-containing protein [Lacisediminihabitans sp. FW035]
MTGQDAVEIERKFDVDDSAQLPTFDELPGVESVAEAVEFELDAVYFDTEDLALAAAHIALRRRSGGEDQGWHLKTVLDADTRQELHEPLGKDPLAVPERLLRQVRVYVRDRAVIPVARLRTRRVVHRLLDAGGGVLAEVCDDYVRADRLLPESTTRTWREWEVELVAGHGDLLDAAEAKLASVGVKPSAHSSKLARALGELRQVSPTAPRPGGTGSAGHVLLAYLETSVRMLQREDPRVREDQTDAVHQFRIALRRLRSALRTFGPLVDPQAAKGLRAELKWMAGTLGAARDLQVLHQRISSLVAAEPSELIIGPICSRIAEHAAADLHNARLTGLASLDDSRYFRLLDSLDSFLVSPLLRGAASEPARRIVPHLIEQDWKRLRSRVQASQRAAQGTERDLALHDVRKSAKQLRYAAEAAAPVHRKSASRVAAAAEEIQTILGEHHDSVVARQVLFQWGADAQLRGEDGFTYGRLHAIEQAAATDAEKRFRRSWKRFPRPSSKKK